jgi:hypothetical protein
MKKTLLLSIAASAVVFAGGEIVPPSEPCPIAEPCAEASKSALKWYGQSVLYYQTAENGAAVTDAELFDGDVSKANAGLKLGVTGANLAGTGLGFGAEIVALGTLGLHKDIDENGHHDFVADTMQKTSGGLEGGELTQAYLTYAIANTTVKVGRMELPKGLSPFAFSESWNVFKNTFEAALVVNAGDVPDTTLVGAWVMRSNAIGNLGAWSDMGANDNGVFMLTAVNKSVAGLTLTGTMYYAPELALLEEDAMIFWGDAKFSTKIAGNTIKVAAQGGMLDVDAEDPTIAYGVKAGGKYDIPAMGNVALCVAYTGVDLQNAADNLSVQNLGTGVKTPLYTQMVANQNAISGATSENGTADTIMVKGSATYDIPALGSTTLITQYSMTERESGAGVSLIDYNELDVIAKTKIKGATVLAAYVHQENDDDNDATDNDIVRVWAKWNF